MKKTIIRDIVTKKELKSLQKNKNKYHFKQENIIEKLNKINKRKKRL